VIDFKGSKFFISKVLRDRFQSSSILV